MAQLAPCAPDLGMRIILSPFKNEAHWIGSRADLESEGLIPAGTIWPVDSKLTRWRIADTLYILRKKAGDDLWKLSTWRSDGNARMRRIKAKADELDKLIYPYIPSRVAAREQFFAARRDRRFQDFKRALFGQKSQGQKHAEFFNQPTLGSAA